MGIEDIELRDPGELTQEMGQAVFNEMFGDEQSPPPEQNQQETVEFNNEAQESQPEPENAQIRLDKFKSQRDEARQELLQTKEALAKLQGTVEAMQNMTKTEVKSVEEVDPTEYMDEADRLNYQKIQGLESTVQKLTEVIQNLQTGETARKLDAQEENFFKERPELQAKREEITDNLLDYLKDKPFFKDALKSGAMNLGEVYGAYQAANPQSTKRAQVSNPNNVFSGSSQPAPASQPKALDANQDYKKALNILHNPDSMNKRQAVKFLESQITNDIISQLD